MFVLNCQQIILPGKMVHDHILHIADQMLKSIICSTAQCSVRSEQNHTLRVPKVQLQMGVGKWDVTRRWVSELSDSETLLKSSKRKWKLSESHIVAKNTFPSKQGMMKRGRVVLPCHPLKWDGTFLVLMILLHGTCRQVHAHFCIRSSISQLAPWLSNIELKLNWYVNFLELGISLKLNGAIQSPEMIPT